SPGAGAAVAGAAAGAGAGGAVASSAYAALDRSRSAAIEWRMITSPVSSIGLRRGNRGGGRSSEPVLASRQLVGGQKAAVDDERFHGLGRDHLDAHRGDGHRL